MNIRNTIAGMALLLSAVVTMAADSDSVVRPVHDIAYCVSLSMNAGTGEFAPYYIASNRHGSAYRSVRRTATAVGV